MLTLLANAPTLVDASSSDVELGKRIEASVPSPVLLTVTPENPKGTNLYLLLSFVISSPMKKFWKQYLTVVPLVNLMKFPTANSAIRPQASF